MKYTELKAKLVKEYDCYELPLKSGKGSHRMWYNPNTKKRATIPYHGSKDLHKGTIGGFIKKLGIDRTKFNKK